MKSLKTILGIALSLGGLGTAATVTGVSIAENNRTVIDSAVQAANTYWSKGDVIYVRLYSGFFDASATAYANYPDGNGAWHSEKITTSISTKGNETLYKYTFSYDASSFQILRKNSTGSEEWGHTNSFTTHSTNIFEVKGYHDAGQHLNAEFASASVVNVSLTQPSSGGTIAVKNVNGSQSGAGYYYSDWSLQFTATPSSSEYFFVNWTDGSSNDWTSENRFNNPVTLSGLAGDYGISCKFNNYADKVFKVLGATSGTWTEQTQDINIPLSYQSGTAGTGDGATYYTTSLSLTAGSVFKPVDVTDGVYYDYDALEEGNNSVKGTHIISDGTTNNNMKVVTTAIYEIYVKSSTGAVWMQLSSQSEAANYANTFLASITCTDNSTAFNINVWNKVSEATTSMEYKYEQLTSGAKNILKTALADKDSSDPIKQCAARYDRILNKYGYGSQSGQYHDFMGRNPVAQTNARTINGSLNSNSNSIIVIIAASILGITSMGAFLILRKKKHN